MQPSYKGYLTVAFAIFAVASSIQVANAQALTNPAKLEEGKTVTPIPDGYSGTNFVNPPTLYSWTFGSPEGTSGILYEYVDRYVPLDSAHPYGGYHFGFEITLSSGDVSSFSVDGYAPSGDPFEVSVKQCSLPMCVSINAPNGVEANEATRSEDGDEITFSFSNLGGEGGHPAGLELFTNAPSYTDPQAFLGDSEGNIFSIAVAGPIAAVPETQTWIMLDV